MIESDRRGVVTARSVVELLSAAYALHPGFGEAEILEMGADARPAFPDNLPRIGRAGERLYANASTGTATCSPRRLPCNSPITSTLERNRNPGMKLTINGEVREIEAATTVAEALAAEGFADARVATAVNGSFVPAAARATTTLASGDALEIVAPMQGG